MQFALQSETSVRNFIRAFICDVDDFYTLIDYDFKILSDYQI